MHLCIYPCVSLADWPILELQRLRYC
jgi:hypothetical protein